MMFMPVPLEGCLEGIRSWHVSDQPCICVKYLSWRTARVMRAKKRCWWSRAAMERQKNLRINFLAQNKKNLPTSPLFFSPAREKIKKTPQSFPQIHLSWLEQSEWWLTVLKLLWSIYNCVLSSVATVTNNGRRPCLMEKTFVQLLKWSICK